MKFKQPWPGFELKSMNSFFCDDIHYRTSISLAWSLLTIFGGSVVTGCIVCMCHNWIGILKKLDNRYLKSWLPISKTVTWSVCYDIGVNLSFWSAFCNKILMHFIFLLLLWQCYKTIFVLSNHIWWIQTFFAHPNNFLCTSTIFCNTKTIFC